MDNEILRVETEVVDKDIGRVYSYYETDKELAGPVPEPPKIGTYHTVYRGVWDMICGRSIEEVLERDAQKTYDEWVARKKAKQNRKQYTFK